MRTFLSPRRLLAAALLAFASFALFATMTRAQEDQGVLAGFISKILSTPASRVSIGAIDGALSSQATIRDITVADPQGVYLRIDTVRISWTRAALLSRRIDIQNLEIGRVEFSRRPAPGDGAPRRPFLRQWKREPRGAVRRAARNIRRQPARCAGTRRAAPLLRAGDATARPQPAA